MSTTTPTVNKSVRNKFKWQLDFTSKALQKVSEPLPSPPGYNLASLGQVQTDSRTGDASLKLKRSWEIALGPFKQVPMNLLIMYMSGNAISIFPIMMVIMMFARPIKTLFTLHQTFRSMDSSGQNTIGQKLVFILGNLANALLAMYKCHSMGLLPTHASDWLAFADPLERTEWAYTSGNA